MVCLNVQGRCPQPEIFDIISCQNIPVMGLLQLLQVHSLSESFKSLFITPQLHIFELGSNLPITRRSLTLYSNICLNIAQPQSFIDNARLWFLTMFLTAKSSIQTVSYVVARYVVNL